MGKLTFCSLCEGLEPRAMCLLSAVTLFFCEIIDGTGDGRNWGLELFIGEVWAWCQRSRRLHPSASSGSAPPQLLSRPCLCLSVPVSSPALYIFLFFLRGMRV
jgi:hypothetical protein